MPRCSSSAVGRTEYLRNNAVLLEIVREFDRQKKWVFGICHGVQILAAAGLVRGKRVTCYEHVRAEAVLAGGIFVGEQAVRDGRLITAQTWQSHPAFYREDLRAAFRIERRSLCLKAARRSRDRTAGCDCHV